MKLRQLLLLLMFLPMGVVGQSIYNLDTVKTYSVYCSLKKDDTIIGWGSNWGSLIPYDSCPEPKEKFYRNHLEAKKYLDARKFIWNKVYNIKDELVLEALQYSDFPPGKFICYHPNGKIKMTGQYDSYTITLLKRYKHKRGEAVRTGVWKYFDEEGNLIKSETY